MSTLIAAYTLGKKHTRMCSALCYNAKHPGCHCICGGINHQQGLLQAAKNLEVILPGIILRSASEGGVVKTPSVQLPMQGGAPIT